MAGLDLIQFELDVIIEQLQFGPAYLGLRELGLRMLLVLDDVGDLPLEIVVLVLECELRQRAELLLAIEVLHLSPALSHIILIPLSPEVAIPSVFLLCGAILALLHLDNMSGLDFAWSLLELIPIGETVAATLARGL
jgi:hypothetical protein